MAQSLTNGLNTGLGPQLKLDQGETTTQSQDGTTKVRRRRQRR